jgi:hypothetical protein
VKRFDDIDYGKNKPYLVLFGCAIFLIKVASFRMERRALLSNSLK